jgi:hypothetical protein
MAVNATAKADKSQERLYVARRDGQSVVSQSGVGPYQIRGTATTDYSVHDQPRTARQPAYVCHDITKSNAPFGRHRCEGYVIPVPDERGHATPQSAEPPCLASAQFDPRQFNENRHGETTALNHRDETTAQLLRPVNRHRQSIYSDCVAAQAQAQAQAQAADREPYTVTRPPGASSQFSDSLCQTEFDVGLR